MKYIKLIILTAILHFSATGCSYVSDTIEGAITDRASFSINAQQVGNDVVLTWGETNNSSDFAGIEIYRTREANDEYSGYITIADRWDTVALASGTTGTYTHLNANATTGVYFYRVGFIDWDEDVADRTSENGYDEPWDGALIETNYNNHTDIGKVSGAARVDIN